MKVLFLSQYFSPEVTAACARVEAFVAALVEAGHEVTVICEVPNHPEGIVQEGYRGRARVIREQAGARIEHVWVRASPEKSSRNRLLFYGTYALSAVVAGSIRKRPDAIVVTSPPLPAAAAAAMVAKRFRVPWIMDVRDIWPEAAVLLGELTNPRMVAAAEKLERWLYRDAAAIVTVTEPFTDHIATNGAGRGKIELIANGTTRRWLLAEDEGEVDRAALGLPTDRFLWTYAGNVGIAQSIETAVRAAELLGPDFQLQIVGDGPSMKHVQAEAAALKHGQVSFTGTLPPDQARERMRASDALLVPLGDSPGLAAFVPSKLFDCAAVGRPVVVSAPDGEARRLARSAEIGLEIDPGNPEALAAAIRRLRDEPDQARRFGENGLGFARRHLREDGAKRFVELVERIGRRRG